MLDEADRVLDPSMAPDVDVVLSALPAAGPKRRTLLFSATITKSLARVKDLALTRPFVWEATPEVGGSHSLVCGGGVWW